MLNAPSGSRLRRLTGILAVLLAAAGSLEAADGRVVRPLTCGPPPPLALMNAPSVVGAGSPNRIASVADITGGGYAWSITNGTIASGQGSNQIVFTAGTAGVTLELTVAITLNGCPFGGGFANVTVAPAGQAVQFYTLTPCRLVDTRGPDGPLGGPALDAAGGGPDRSFAVAGTCGIPPEATSLSVNVTAVGGSGPGDLEIYPGDGVPAGTSTISFAGGQTRANNAQVQLATDGSGTIKAANTSSGPVHLVLDVNGYFE
ncbi:MAG TPA: hypothetical protein VMN04_08660 [Thermoanaerobaculia bacterium]|nr:hypothetical protein [Thermoanaerobaculia bacterium]